MQNFPKTNTTYTNTIYTYHYMQAAKSPKINRCAGCLEFSKKCYDRAACLFDRQDLSTFTLRNYNNTFVLHLTDIITT